MKETAINKYNVKHTNILEIYKGKGWGSHMCIFLGGVDLNLVKFSNIMIFTEHLFLEFPDPAKFMT